MAKMFNIQPKNSFRDPGPFLGKLYGGVGVRALIKTDPGCGL